MLTTQDDRLSITHPHYCRFVRDFNPASLVKLVCHTRLESSRTAEFFTFRVKLPARLDGELRTHRQISKNAASFRAIPTDRFLDVVLKDPFIPWAWTAAQPGMQGPLIEDVDQLEALCKSRLAFRDLAVAASRSEQALGVHKQEANRLVQPFAWLPYLLTIRKQHLPRLTRLRTGNMAERHFQSIACAMAEIAAVSKPHLHRYHLPYVNQIERQKASFEDLAFASGARCARISLNRDDEHNELSVEIEKGKALSQNDPPHATPFEHQVCLGGRPTIGLQGNFALYSEKTKEPIADRVVQFRKLIPNE